MKMPESTRHAGGQLELECQPECLLHSFKFGMLTTGFDWVHRDSESGADDSYVASSTGYYESDRSRRIFGQKPQAHNSLQQPQLESRCLALPAAK